MPTHLLTILLLILAATTTQAHPPKPNIILILADDMGFSDLGCYGGEIYTPSIDRLASQGVRFTQFYNMARCCPSRAALLTGLYPHQAGIGAMNQDLGKPAYQGELNARCVTLAQVLRENGYRTAMTGKWHLTHLNISAGGPNAKKQLNFEAPTDLSPSKTNWPVNRGFEEHWGTIPGVENYYDPYGLVHNETTLNPDHKDFYYTDFITQKSLDLIDQFSAPAENAKPFFMYIAYTAPHWPMQAREQDINRYKDTYTVGWDKIRQARLDRQIAMKLLDENQSLSPRPTSPRFNEGASAVGPWENATDKSWQARRMATYAAMVETMDRGVGKILDKLQQQNLEQNTIVIFLSDNGGCAENVRPEWYDIPSKTRDGRTIHVGNDPKFSPGPEEVYQSYGPAWANASNTPFRRFKHFSEEGGISTPFIIRQPTGNNTANPWQRPGQIERAPIAHVIDLMPTILELTGATYPKTHKGHDIPPPEGQSLLPAIAGQPFNNTRPLFWEHEGNRAVRIGDYKLLAAHNENWQLYNIANDRAETKDLAKEQPEKVKELSQAYQAWTQRINVEPWPVKSNKQPEKSE